MTKVIEVIANYSQTPLRTWTATIEADIDPASGELMATQVSATTLKECQQAVLDQIQELADTVKGLYNTVHLLDGDPQKFIQAYATHIGFADSGWQTFD